MSIEAWAPVGRGGDDGDPAVSDSARLARNGHFVRLFLTCICLAEIVILVPNLLTEIALERGLYAPVLRAVLSVVRLSPLVWPLLSKLGRPGAQLRHFVEVSLPTFYDPACGGVEPCRGLATALSGWYLISTPMHDAFTPRTEDADMPLPPQEPEFDEQLLLPCAVIMSANVGLFLCDALSLTVTPLLRHPEPATAAIPHLPRAEAFVATGPDDIDSAKFEPTCVICIAEFQPGEALARLPCGHTFHRECVSEWLSQHRKCPLRCAGLVLPPERGESEEADGAGPLSEILAPWLVGASLARRPLFSESSMRSSASPADLPSTVGLQEAVEEDVQ
ncbi:unnamed protein product [Effrenium voratum]|nr:unnamed protein product [Effrenium voratum]CAJ1460635.1 unnamed protein product [Effrenium voratum]